MGTSIPLRSNGQEIDQTWFNVIRSEVSTLDDRVDAIASGQSIPFNVYGRYNDAGSIDNLIIHKITQSITITSAVLHIVSAGSAGSTKVMLKRIRSGASVNIFSTAPIVPATAGDNANSSTGSGATSAVIVASVQSLIPGDLLALDLQQSQSERPDTFILTVYHTTDGV